MITFIIKYCFKGYTVPLSIVKYKARLYTSRTHSEKIPKQNAKTNSS